MAWTSAAWSSSGPGEINKRCHEYWPLVLYRAPQQACSHLRCTQIMGRSETDELAARRFYPACGADTSFSARTSASSAGPAQGEHAPARILRGHQAQEQAGHLVAPHAHGSKQGQEKMSNPTRSPIFMEDSEADVNASSRRRTAPGLSRVTRAWNTSGTW